MTEPKANASSVNVSAINTTTVLDDTLSSTTNVNSADDDGSNNRGEGIASLELVESILVFGIAIVIILAITAVFLWHGCCKGVVGTNTSQLIYIGFYALLAQ